MQVMQVDTGTVNTKLRNVISHGSSHSMNIFTYLGIGFVLTVIIAWIYMGLAWIVRIATKGIPPQTVSHRVGRVTRSSQIRSRTKK